MFYCTATADHVYSAYSCTAQPVKIGTWIEDGVTSYHATIDGYGMSKLAATPKDAVVNMLISHGCTNIRVDSIDELINKGY